MRPRAVIVACALLLFTTGCAHMFEMEGKRWNDFHQRVSSLNDWELESLHRDIRQRIDRIRSPATFVTSSSFGIGAASVQLQGLQQQRMVVESEMERRGKRVPGKGYSLEKFLRRQ